MIFFSLPILDSKFSFFLQHLPSSIQGGGLYFIFLVSKTTSLKWVRGDQP
jgi:hypothetical protein